mgnify:CR=1 FL=1
MKTEFIALSVRWCRPLHECLAAGGDTVSERRSAPSGYGESPRKAHAACRRSMATAFVAILEGPMRAAITSRANMAVTSCQ